MVAGKLTWAAAWTWTCSMNMDMHNLHGLTAWTWTCSRDTDMQHRHGHAAWPMDIDMQHHAAT